MKPLGKATGTKGVRGIPTIDIVVMLSVWAACATWFCLAPGYASATCIGLAMTWIGMGVQHTANHGGLTESSTLNYLIGLTDDICVGGSSLVWRYHHQVSHHCYCNEVELDQDVHSSFPLLRLDLTQKREWYHAYQHFYAFPALCGLYFSVQLADFNDLMQSACYKVRFLGTGISQKQLAWVLKGIHFGWFWALPFYLHGAVAIYFSCVAALVGSFWTALLFIVSHNLEACKPGYKMPDLAIKDWAVWQIETSASWGGSIACYLTGGLNLQVILHSCHASRSI